MTDFNFTMNRVRAHYEEAKTIRELLQDVAYQIMKIATLNELI